MFLCQCGITLDVSSVSLPPLCLPHSCSIFHKSLNPVLPPSTTSPCLYYPPASSSTLDLFISKAPVAESRLAIHGFLRCGSCNESFSLASTCGRLLSVSNNTLYLISVFHNVRSGLKMYTGDFIERCFLVKN